MVGVHWCESRKGPRPSIHLSNPGASGSLSLARCNWGRRRSSAKNVPQESCQRLLWIADPIALRCFCATRIGHRQCLGPGSVHGQPGGGALPNLCRARTSPHDERGHASPGHGRPDHPPSPKRGRKGWSVRRVRGLFRAASPSRSAPNCQATAAVLVLRSSSSPSSRVSHAEGSVGAAT